MARKPPLGVIILGVLTIIKFAYMGVHSLLSLLTLNPFAILYIALSFFGILVGLGLLSLQKWFWNVAVVYFVLALVGDVLAGHFIGALVTVALLVYLTAVRDQFR